MNRVEPLTLSGEVHIEYQWTVGIAGSRFFAELRDHKRIMGTKCPQCARVMVPPRIFCEECFVDADQWVEVSNRGELVTFGDSYLSPEGRQLDKPWMLGIVKLDGADGGLIHYLGETKPEDVKIGMRMEAVFADKREGNIKDIKYFRPLK